MGLDTRKMELRYGVEAVILMEVIEKGSEVVGYRVLGRRSRDRVGVYDLAPSGELVLYRLDEGQTRIISRIGLKHTLLCNTNYGMIDCLGRYLVCDGSWPEWRLGTWNIDGTVGNLTKLPRIDLGTCPDKGLVEFLTKAFAFRRNLIKQIKEEREKEDSRARTVRRRRS